VLVERYVRGDEHRLLVVGGKVVAAARGEAAWVSAPATVTKILETRQGYENFVGYMRWVLDEQKEWSAEEKVLDILRGGTNTVFELQKGERFVWPARLTAVLVRQAQGWRFRHMQFSFPTTRFPDVRRTD